MTDTDAPRPGTRRVGGRHRFDEWALERWLTTNLDGFEGPMTVLRFEGGQSNPTYLLSAASGEYVLRKKHPGELLPSAHAVDREFRVLEALQESDVPVPPTRVFCDDETIVGTPFYVMDFVEGRILTDPLLPSEDAGGRAAIYDSMNQTLAALHLFDWKAGGLDGFGRPDGYFARQVARWSSQLGKIPLQPSAELESLRKWLIDNVPDDETTAVVHGDYRLGNLIIDPSTPTVIGVLDWELCTIGHPLADLAFNCMVYHLPAALPVAPGFVGSEWASLGIPTEEEYLEAYTRRSGHDPAPLWRFCMAFSLYRTAAIQLGIHARAVHGNASSDTAREFGGSHQMVAEAGWRVARGG